MALAHITSIRNGLADLVVDAIDVGAGSNGDLQIGTTGFAAILATIAFQATAFGAAVGGTATMNGAPLEDASAAGGGGDRANRASGATCSRGRFGFRRGFWLSGWETQTPGRAYSGRVSRVGAVPGPSCMDACSACSGMPGGAPGNTNRPLAFVCVE